MRKLLWLLVGALAACSADPATIRACRDMCSPATVRSSHGEGCAYHCECAGVADGGRG